MIDFPVELVQEIVAALSTPENPLQFGHKDDVRDALLQLSLTSHVLRDIATPILYSTIIISSPRELHAFLSASPVLRSFTTSLWLRNFSKQFYVAAELIRLLGDTLRRLALDIPGNELDASPSVREALRSCTHLVDFVHSGYSPMRVSQPRPFWPDWMGLRRLTLDGPLVDDKFISYIKHLPHLTHLALIEPGWRYSADGTEVAVFLRLVKAGKNLQQLLLIYCRPEQLHLNSLKRLKSGMAFEPLRRSPRIFYIIMEEPIKGMACIRRQVGDGTLWDLRSRKLLGSPIGKRGLDQLDIICRAQALKPDLFLHEASPYDVIQIQ